MPEREDNDKDTAEVQKQMLTQLGRPLTREGGRMGAAAIFHLSSYLASQIFDEVAGDKIIPGGIKGFLF